MFMKVVMPTAAPAASRTVNGSIQPVACKPRRRSISAAMPSGDGTVVYQSRQSSPSRTASASSAAYAGASGSSVACTPRSVTGFAKVMNVRAAGRGAP